MDEVGWQATHDRWKISGLNQQDWKPFIEVGKLNDLQHGSDLEGHSAVLIHLGPVARLWVRPDTDMAVVTKIIRSVSASGLT